MILRVAFKNVDRSGFYNTESMRWQPGVYAWSFDILHRSFTERCRSGGCYVEELI